MRVLFTDDSKRRFEKFQSNMVGWVIDWATTPAEAIDLLTKSTYDIVFLDYDFDEEHTGVNGWGSDIAEHIADNAERFSETFVVIHSLNKEGRSEILEIIEDADIPTVLFPFVWDESPAMVLAYWKEKMKG